MEGGDNQQGEHDARTGDICLVEPSLFNPATYMKRIWDITAFRIDIEPLYFAKKQNRKEKMRELMHKLHQHKVTFSKYLKKAVCYEEWGNRELDWIEQPACRDLVYIIEYQEDTANNQMQVM